MIDQIKRRFNEAEHLVHETKKNHARFDFDARFPKMPSYLKERRSSMRSGCFLAIPYKVGTVWKKWSDFRKENEALYMKTMRCRYFIGVIQTESQE